MPERLHAPTGATLDSVARALFAADHGLPTVRAEEHPAWEASQEGYLSSAVAALAQMGEHEERIRADERSRLEAMRGTGTVGAEVARGSVVRISDERLTAMEATHAGMSEQDPRPYSIVERDELTALLAEARASRSRERLGAFARAVAAATPCSCSAQRSRADRAEAKLTRVEEAARRLSDTSSNYATSEAGEAILILLGAATADGEGS